MYRGAIEDVASPTSNRDLLTAKSDAKLVEAVLHLKHVLSFIQIDSYEQVNLLPR
jgi:hypothetical protein